MLLYSNLLMTSLVKSYSSPSAQHSWLTSSEDHSPVTGERDWVTTKRSEASLHNSWTMYYWSEHMDLYTKTLTGAMNGIATVKPVIFY